MTDPDAAEIRTVRFAAAGGVPNNPDLPVLMAAGALAGRPDAQAVASLLRGNGWGGVWTWSVFPYHHYHPNAHEVLAVSRGAATLALGGPEGRLVEVACGDVLVLPAGTGHKLDSARDGFEVCGAYPPGQEDYETVRADAPAPDGVAARIAAVPRPLTDPIWGEDGPLVRHWS